MTPSQRRDPLAGFAAEIRRWRNLRGLSMKQLARRMGFDPSYISHIEGQRYGPSQEFAWRAEAILDSGREILRRFAEYEALQDQHQLRDPVPTRPSSLPSPTTVPGGVLIEREVASLTYRQHWYHCDVQRTIYNGGSEPVIRYPVRIDVDRRPDDEHTSDDYYHDHPLSWDELSFSASLESPVGRPLGWKVLHDRDSFKKLLLLFDGRSGASPLAPRHRMELRYSYRVRDDKWGPWFQRNIRFPTNELLVRLDFPAAATPTVWGVQSTHTSEAALHTAPRRINRGERVTFEWGTTDPALATEYRLQWRFTSRSA
jgi:transcriptional regulator with XRE-family HTH domain